MTRPQGDDDRLRRVRGLREAWRGDQGSRDAPDTDDTASTDASRRRKSDALDSNDRIRAEAPDDAETQRRADQVEREIKRAGRRRSR